MIIPAPAVTNRLGFFFSLPTTPISKRNSGQRSKCCGYRSVGCLEGFISCVSYCFILGVLDLLVLGCRGAPMNNGDRLDLLSDRARAMLDRQLRECGGEQLLALEHALRLFNKLVELQQSGNILPGDVILIECAQELRNALNHFELAPVALFRRIDEKA